jgi:DHA3 family macrolide efflux protein-like MFS transporter
MVPERHLARVAGLNQALPALGTIVAPPLGALLLEVLPLQSILAIDVGTALLAITPLFFVHVPQPDRVAAAEGASRPSMVADLREALHFLRGWPGLLMVVVIGALVNLLIFPAISLQPLLVTEHFGGDALHLAWMQSTFGLGMVAGGITLGAWGGFKRRALTGLLALALNGVGLVVVGLTPAGAFPLALGGMFLAWFMNPIANGALFALLQTIVPADMQGRVFTLLQSATGAMVPLGLAIAGPLADVVGVRIWFLAAGLAMAVMGVGALFVPAIMRVEDAVAGELEGAATTGEPAPVPATAR